MNECSKSQADAADGSVMDGDVEQAIYSRTNRFGASASSIARGREQLERASEDLSGSVLSRLESQFADLFR